MSDQRGQHQPIPHSPPPQPGNPYAQPYGQPYAPPHAQPYGQPHGQPYAPPHGQPHGQPPAQPYGPPSPHPQPVRVPEPAGDERRIFAAAADCVLALGCGFPLGMDVLPKFAAGVEPLLLGVACVFGLSIVNQVLGAWIFRASLGKWMLRMRVVRETDAGRPGFWRLLHRWLLGLTWLPMQPVRYLACADGDPYEDHCKIRYVRVKDLRRLGLG